MLGYRLVLRIRDLPSKRLYVFNPAGTPKDLRKLAGGKIREELIIASWLRQNDLAVALREGPRGADALYYRVDP